METDKSKINEKILNLTLEIICLVTGEDYTIVKKTSGKYEIHEEKNEQKILELINKIIELLTGEVSLRYQDVTVHLSMEEWKYLKGHKDLYWDIMMENHQNLTSLVGLGQKDQNKELDPSAPSPNFLKEDDQEIYGNVQRLSEKSNSCTMEEVVITTMTQYPSINMKEKPSCDRGNLTKSNMHSHIDHTMYGSPQFIEEPCLCNEGNFPNPNIYRLMEQKPQYTSTHSKEELFSCDGGNLTDHNIYSPTDLTQQHPTIYIKEQASFDQDLTDTDSYTTADHTQYVLPYIKKEPVPSDNATLMDLNIYIPTDHTQYLSSHIKKEPVSCDGGNLMNLDSYTSTDHIHQYPTTDIKVEQASCEKDRTDASSYTPRDHTKQYPSKKEPVLDKVPSIQKSESSPGKPVDNDVSKKINKEAEQNYNNLTISSKKYFCTVQQTKHSLEILYNCPECPECFTSNLDLAKHQIIHTGGMPFICSICGRCFGRKADLVIHQATHEGGNDFGRPHCDLSFATMSSLSIHEKTHGQKKPLPCPECGKTFPTKKRLTRHRKIHTDERPFKCSECGDTFKRKAHLQRHQTIHEKARQQMTCNECEVHLTDKVQLLKHQLKHPRPKPFQSPLYKKFYNSKGPITRGRPR